MHQRREAVAARGEEDGEDLVVAELQRAVGHEDLDRGDAPGAERGQGREGGGGRVADQHVQAVVAVGAVVGFGLRGIDGGDEAVVVDLGREGDDGRGAAGDG